MGRLVEALAAAHLAAHQSGDVVVCDGTTPSVVGPILVDHRIEVHEMTSSAESLESLFFALTGGEGNGPEPRCGPDGGEPTGSRWAADHPTDARPGTGGGADVIRLLRAETRKLWTIWSTYVLFGIVVVVDLVFGFARLRTRGRRGGTAGIIPHGSEQWFANVFSVLEQLATYWPSSSAS